MLADEAVSLPPAVVIDVGLADVGWVVVEANACWASGLCGCDPREVLRTIRRASVRTGELREDEKPWARSAHMCAKSG
jgi:hypothetical protein